MAVAVIAGTVAWYVHPHHSFWAAQSSVPNLAVIALRNSDAIAAPDAGEMVL